MNDFDAIIIGAGHNGLTCAAYLGAAGLKVKVIERRSVVGGAAVTEEFHPGFRNSVAAYAVSLLHPQVIRDLALERHGLRIVERRAQNFLPTLGGDFLLAGEGRTGRELAKFSARDAERYAAFIRELDAIAEVLRTFLLKPPPNIVAGLTIESVGELFKVARVGNALRALTMDQRRGFLDLFTKSAADYLDGWFEGELAKALFGFDAVVGNYASPCTPGTAYMLLHNALGEVNGKKRVWGHAIGGMGAITQAIAKAAGEHGVDIETGAAVREVIVARDGVGGVALDDGRMLRAPIVAAGVEPKLLYTRLIPDGTLPAPFLERIRRWRCASGTFRMNVALSRLPQFAALPGTDVGDHHTSGIILAPSLGYMDRAYHDARAHGWSREPIIEMLIPSTLDDSLAPRGAHVASLFCQHAAPTLPDGSSWDAHRDAVAEVMIDTVERFAPGFKGSVVARTVLSPLDLERDFALTGGDIFHGALTLDQLYSARPMLGHADYRGPIAGLYHCGAGAHPGGGVSGAPGHNAARVILGDVRRRHRKRGRSA
jgi:phytoene dehydrogenase-like protein